MKEKSCGCIILENNKVLLVKQIDGHYTFPKGHIEDNETEEETAIRETFEETGLKVEINKNFRYIQHYFVKNNVPKEVVFFLAKRIGGTLKKQDTEISELGFYDIEDALNLITYEDTKLILNKILIDINKKDI